MMNAGSKQLLLLLLSSISLAVNLTNGQSKKKEAKFRMEKINYVWDKAVTQMSSQQELPNRLGKLQKDLSSFDSLYLSLKQDVQHMKATEKGVDEIDAKLEALLKRYDLEDTIYAFRMKYKYDSAKLYSATADASQPSSNAKQHETFKDARLLKMWETVKADKGFSLTELDDFYNELREQEEKLTDYNQLLKQISAYEQEHNHILKDEHEEELNERHQQQLLTVKQMNQEMEDNLQKMQKRLDQIKENPFKNAKVRSLWNKAVKNVNLIPNELDAIKSELRHFERQLEKIDFHKGHLGEAQEFSQGVGKEAGHTDELYSYQEKMARKIKKLEHYLDDKLSVVHSEL